MRILYIQHFFSYFCLYCRELPLFENIAPHFGHMPNKHSLGFDYNLTMLKIVVYLYFIYFLELVIIWVGVMFDVLIGCLFWDIII